MALADPPVDLDPGSDTEHILNSKDDPKTAAAPATDTTAPPNDTTNPPEEPTEDEDDYMNMSFASPPTITTNKPPPETSLQRRARLKREASARAHPKSKAELAASSAAKRETGLATSLDESNKGFRMMAKLGFKPGAALGREGGEGRTEPVAVEVKEGRGGVGADAERKRKVREEVEMREVGVKRRREEEGDFRIRVAREREERRVEGLVVGAMGVCERLEAGKGEELNDSGAVGKGAEGEGEGDEGEGTLKQRRRRTTRPLQNTPLIYRTLIHTRLEKDREKRMRQDLNNSIGKGLPTYNDPGEDEDYRRAFAQEEVELEQEDPELEEFNSLEAAERLRRIVEYLREKHWYCFWCKMQYKDEGLEGCPGWTEEDHD